MHVRLLLACAVVLVRAGSSQSRAVTAEVIAAAGRGDDAAVLAWLDGGGRVDATYADDQSGQSELSLLMVAAQLGSERVVDLLLRRGAEIDMQSSIGVTALMLAATNGHERVVDFLLQRGAEVNMQSSDSLTVTFHD